MSVAPASKRANRFRVPSGCGDSASSGRNEPNNCGEIRVLTLCNRTCAPAGSQNGILFGSVRAGVLLGTVLGESGRTSVGSGGRTRSLGSVGECKAVGSKRQHSTPSHRAPFTRKFSSLVVSE